MSASTRIPLPDLRLRPRLLGGRWLEVPGHVLHERRGPFTRRVGLPDAVAVAFRPSSRALALEVRDGSGSVEVPLLHLADLRSAGRTAAELSALADGLTQAPGPDAATAVAALRAQARFLTEAGQENVSVSPLARHVGEEGTSWTDVGHWLP